MCVVLRVWARQVVDMVYPDAAPSWSMLVFVGHPHGRVRPAARASNHGTARVSLDSGFTGHRRAVGLGWVQ